MQAPAAASQSSIVSKANGTATRLTATDLPRLITISKLHSDDDLGRAEFLHQTIGGTDRHDHFA